MNLLRHAILPLLLMALPLAPASAATVLRVDARSQPDAPEVGYLKMGTATAPSGQRLDVNGSYLVLNGKPWLPVAGEFHFSRFPHQYWEEELEKMKTAGVEIVSTYIFWNHQEAKEGHFDWSGDRDLRRFVTLAGKHGLKVILRAGPWAHAESRFGGLPDWVVRAMPTRTNDPVYLHYVARYYGQVATQMKGLLWKDGGPVIGLQLENEYYATGPGNGADHIAALKTIALKAGLDVPLYTVTGFHDSDNYPAHEVIPMQGGYADQPWSLSINKLPPAENYVFRLGNFWSESLGAETSHLGTDITAATVRHYPLLSAEFGGGVPTMYRRRPRISGDDVAAMLPVELGSGINLYGYYMFHGGQQSPDHDADMQESTAIGAPNDLPLLDYDFQAPLGTYGQQHDSMNKIRPIHYFLEAFGTDLAPMMPHKPDIAPQKNADFLTPRFAVRSLGDSGFLFVNNHVHQYAMAPQKDVQFAVALPGGTVTFPSTPFDIAPDAYFIWPINMNLGGARLVYATVQPVTRLNDAGGPVYVFRAVDNIPAEFAFDGANEVAASSGTVTHDGARMLVKDVRPGSDAVITVKSATGTMRLVVLSATQGEHLSLVSLAGRAHLVLTQAQLYADKDGMTLLSMGNPHFTLAVFPAPVQALSANLAMRKIRSDGIFQVFEADAAPRNLKVDVTRLHDAQPVPPLPLTGPSHTAAVPVPETFGKSAAWAINVAGDAASDQDDAFLRIRARGDVGRLFAGSYLMDDHFFDGSTWEIGLKRFSAKMSAPLTLTVLPMRKDAAIYLDDGVGAMVSGEQTAELLDVSVVPQYRLTVSMAGASKRR
jgi:beta-galactosidase